MPSPQQKWLLCKISLALLMLDGCARQAATEIEYTKRMYQFHYVNKGETLDQIADYYKMSRDEVIRINQLRPPYQLVVGHRLHVHKREFVVRTTDVQKDPPLTQRFEKKRDRLWITDLEDSPAPKTNKIPKTTPVVIKRKGLGKLLVPLVALGGTFAALKPRTAFAATSGGGSSTSTSTPSGNPQASIISTGSQTNPFSFNDVGTQASYNAPAPIETREQFFKESAMPAIAALTGIPLIGAGAALLMNASKKKRAGKAMMASDPKMIAIGCDTRPCFVWPINNKKRVSRLDKNRKGIFIINTMGERYVRPANHGVIEKILPPKNLGNDNMYTIVISHSYGTCRSSYKTVYSGLTNVPSSLTPGMYIGRDFIIGELRSCCDSNLFFQILDGDTPVASTLGYLPPRQELIKT